MLDLARAAPEKKLLQVHPLPSLQSLKLSSLGTSDIAFVGWLS